MKQMSSYMRNHKSYVTIGIIGLIKITLCMRIYLRCTYVVTWTPSIHRGPRNRPRRHSRHAPMRVLLHFILAYSHHLCSPTYPTRRKLWPRRWRVVEPRPRLEFHATPCTSCNTRRDWPAALLSSLILSYLS